MNWQGVCIHHSGTRDSASSSWEAIRHYHIEHNGWRDIGYHYGIEEVGDTLRLRIGRPLNLQGAHEPAYNRTHIGICLVGNFDKQRPGRDLIDITAMAVADIFRFYGIDPNEQTLRYHSDVSGKTCPGAHWPPKGVLLRLVTAKMEALS